MTRGHTLTLRSRGDIQTIPFSGTPLLADVLQAHGVPFAHPCGGRGVCKKCAVEALGNVSPPNDTEQSAGVRLSCQMRLLGDCEVTLRDDLDGTAQAQAPQTDTPLLLAADIGTTTLEIRLIDPATMASVYQATARNLQADFAADVVGRITASLAGKATVMRTQLLHALKHLLGGAQVTRAVFAGNTVMLYLLTGRSPKALAAAPFVPDCLFGHTEPVLDVPVYLPRCTGAFTGADLTCAMVASGITERADTALLCDIGTNGEIALWHKGRLLVTSAATGPAFEGAGISCGMGGVPGAIDKVWAANNALDAHVIGGGAPLGICGSGLIDAVAALLRLRLIDEFGTMDGKAVPIRGDIALTQQDIRQVQLAKAAVSAAIETLLDTAGAAVIDVQTLYIAGGFGSHLDARNAAAIGLFPVPLAPRVRVLGNAALDGAAMLLQEKNRQRADEIAAMAEPVPLGGNPAFAKRYLQHMNFR